MDDTIALLIIWIVISVLLLAIVVGLRWRRNNNIDISLTEVISLGTIILGAIASYRLLNKVFTSSELRKLLELDELAVLVIGIISVSWVSVKEIWKSIKS